MTYTAPSPVFSPPLSSRATSSSPLLLPSSASANPLSSRCESAVLAVQLLTRESSRNKRLLRSFSSFQEKSRCPIPTCLCLQLLLCCLISFPFLVLTGSSHRRKTVSQESPIQPLNSQALFSGHWLCSSSFGTFHRNRPFPSSFFQSLLISSSLILFTPPLSASFQLLPSIFAIFTFQGGPLTPFAFSIYLTLESLS